MVNFHILVISLAVSLWSREVHSMDCSEICRVPELIYHCCQCIGCHQGLSPNAIAPAMAGLRFGKRSASYSPEAAQQTESNSETVPSRYVSVLPRRWILSSVLY
ncbi:hypothetical protein ANCCAN_02872 [Ancylostoma caninum]|uniref:Secreted protein n=1 Tax=Ancylostoma caninum TaxID=29170 RepID=A0A368H742_ANCCA|nr:hypothetical protein ANCCAN_02872 [Ancylostoma caninum]